MQPILNENGVKHELGTNYDQFCVITFERATSERLQVEHTVNEVGGKQS